MGLLDYLYGRRDTGQPLLDGDASGVDSVGNPLFMDPRDAAEAKRRALDALAAAAEPGSLRRAWEASETRNALNEGIPYYLGPHAAQVVDKVGTLGQLATPQFGTGDAREAGHALDVGNYGKAAGALALGTAGAALDMIPGEALVKGALKGVTKAIQHGGELAPGLSIFAGVGAKTADRAALAKAEELAASGADRGAIWGETGWFQGADGKWRFEIPDNKATKTDLQGAGTYAEHLNHPALSEAYPDVAGARTFVGDLRGPDNGTYWPPSLGEESIEVYGRTPEGQRSSLLHEGTHAIQEREGFARGGNQNGLKPGTPAWDIYQERLQAIRTPMTEAEFKASGQDFPYPEYLKQHKAALKGDSAAMIDRAAQDYAVQEAYRRSAGEVEARNVQARRDMTPEERAARPPWETQDVPDAKQIIRFRQDGPQMSMPLLDRKGTGQPLLDGDVAGTPKGALGSGPMRDMPNKPMKGDVLVDVPVGLIDHGDSALPGGKLTWPGAQDTIRSYADMPTELPPVSLISDGSGRFFLEDGSHRLEAAKLRGQDTVKAYVSKDDAGLAALPPATLASMGLQAPEKASQ